MATSSSAAEQDRADTREAALLIGASEDDDVVRCERHSRVFKIAALVSGTVAVVLVGSAMLAPKYFRPFASQSDITLSEETATEDTEEGPREGYHFEMHCGIDYRLRNVLHNNLGGAGPDSGKEGIVYNATQTNNGEFVRNVLVKLNALSDYDSESSSKNGMHEDFGSIRVDAGKKVHLEFSFYTEDDEPLTLSVFRITFYDLDEAQGHNSIEYVIADGEPEVDMTDNTELETEEVKAGTKIKATEVGSDADNPDKSTLLTQSQRDRSAVMEYKDVHSIKATLGSSSGAAPRAFAFALHSALACEQVEVPDESGAAMNSPAARLLVVVVGSLLLALTRF